MKLNELLEKLSKFVHVKVIFFDGERKVLITSGIATDVDTDLFLASYEDWIRKVIRIFVEENELVILVE